MVWRAGTNRHKDHRLVKYALAPPAAGSIGMHQAASTIPNTKAASIRRRSGTRLKQNNTSGVKTTSDDWRNPEASASVAAAGSTNLVAPSETRQQRYPVSAEKNASTAYVSATVP